eukprot:Gb_14558 [translate_table: standard]
MAFPNITRWLWRRRDSIAQPRPTKSSSQPSAAAASSSPTSASKPRGKSRGAESAVSGGQQQRHNNGKKSGPRRQWRGRRESRIDTEFDSVLVPTEVECMSGSESGDSDWSIGWYEPHSSELSSENGSENSFAVLVPCYGIPSGPVVESWNGDYSQKSNNRRRKEFMFNGSRADNNHYVEEWLSSRQRH